MYQFKTVGAGYTILRIQNLFFYCYASVTLRDFLFIVTVTMSNLFQFNWDILKPIHSQNGKEVSF